MDRGQGNQSWAASHGLRNVDNIVLCRTTGAAQQTPAQAGRLDDQVIIAGSFNFTLPATRVNDENIIVIGSNHEEDPDGPLAQEALAIMPGWRSTG